MADIEDRILKHSHAFEGLLSLVPVVEKRKLTKEEKGEEAKKAKKAKPNHEIGLRVENKKDPAQKKEKKGGEKKALKEPAEAPATTEAATSTDKGGQPKGKNQKNQQRKADAKKEDSKDNVITEKGEKSERTAKTGGITPNPPPISPPQKKQKFTKPPPPQDTSPLSSPSSANNPTDPSTATTTTTPEAEPTKPVISPSARAEARARLTAHIDSFRARRKSATGPTHTRAALLEAREKKDAARKERKKVLRLSKKLESESCDNAPASPASLVRPPPLTEKEMEKAANNFTFSAIQFDDGQELDHTLHGFRKAKERKGPTDVMGQIKQVEAKKARLETMDPEKREKICEKEMWGKALKQTVGEKVRDDEKLLKKALKRQVVQKKKSEREWKERKDSVAKGIAIRQKKREENINTRKEQKKLGKSGMKKKAKAAKSGGKKKSPQHSKNKGGKSGLGDKPSKPAGKTGGGEKKSGR